MLDLLLLMYLTTASAVVVLPEPGIPAMATRKRALLLLLLLLALFASCRIVLASRAYLDSICGLLGWVLRYIEVELGMDLLYSWSSVDSLENSINHHGILARRASFYIL